MIPSRYGLLLCLTSAWASVGDRLPQFQDCRGDCVSLVCNSATPQKYTENTVNPLLGFFLLWDCQSDCNYKCQQIITNQRLESGEALVQFDGKWPFVRVLGITEVFSTVFSLANFYANILSYKRMRQYQMSIPSSAEDSIMVRQYVLLLIVSMVGWIFSTIFHTRDFPITETMDYLGAGAIILANFNAIMVRFFELHRRSRTVFRQAFQLILLAVLCIHYLKLFHHWDYAYNMKFNTIIGVSAASLWISHSLKVNRRYQRHRDLYNTTLKLRPYENRIMEKLRWVGLGVSYIPLVPVALNLFLICSVSLELNDFPPIFLLLDSHSIWHLCTIFPPLIWYDWNIWDIEVASVTVV